MKKSQDGFIEVLGALFVIGFVFLVFFSIFFVRFSGRNEEVSGIVYNTSYNHLISGNATFSVRAGIDTYVSQENQSTYCLPPNSPYLALVRKAAADKNVKVIVTTDKYFSIQAPWTCHNNVKVTEVK